jgi:hypothetical protein
MLHGYRNSLKTTKIVAVKTAQSHQQLFYGGSSLKVVEVAEIVVFVRERVRKDAHSHKCESVSDCRLNSLHNVHQTAAHGCGDNHHASKRQFDDRHSQRGLANFMQ